MSKLRIRKREASGEWWQIWPDSRDIPEGVIEEDGEYEFELTDVESPDDTSLVIDGSPLRALRCPDDRTARWIWSPGFYSGLVRIEIRFGSVRRDHAEVQVNPQLAKLTRRRYNRMVEDILEDTTALFSIGPYRTGIGRGTSHGLPPIARLEYLLSKLDDIVHVVRQIDQNPVRILKSQKERVKHHRARNVTGRELVRSFRSGSILEETREPGSLPERLGSAYPATIQKESVETGLDIQEHREIKSALASWKNWLQSVSNRLDAAAGNSEHNRRTQWALRCRERAAQLGQLLELPLFDSVADISEKPTISSIYRQKRTYRDFFSLYQELNRGLSNITGESLEIPLSRTYELYELWCFLRIARALAEESWTADPDVSELFANTGQGGLSIAAGNVTLEYGDDLILAYQESFQEYWAEKSQAGSISRVMRPDIALIREDGDEYRDILILDAKYQIGSGLNKSLSSVHTYRDAIVKEGHGGNLSKIVSGGFLLAPHDPEPVSDWKNAQLPDRLFDHGYRVKFSLGAASLKPGMSLSTIQEMVQRLCNAVDFPYP